MEQHFEKLNKTWPLASHIIVFLSRFCAQLSSVLNFRNAGTIMVLNLLVSHMQSRYELL